MPKHRPTKYVLHVSKDEPDTLSLGAYVYLDGVARYAPIVDITKGAEGTPTVTNWLLGQPLYRFDGDYSDADFERFLADLHKALFSRAFDKELREA